MEANPVEMRLLTVGSLPPEWGGAARGGVATFHTTLLEGLMADGRVELLGVVASAPGGKTPLPVFERPEDVPTARFYEGLLDRLRPDVVLMNHVAHTIGVTHAGLDDPPPAVGVVHSWHNVTFAEPGQAEERRQVTQRALDGLAAMVVGSRHCLAEGERIGMRYPSLSEAIHYPLQPLYAEPGIDPYAAERRGALFLGSLIPRKSPETLLGAAALLPGLEVTLAGEGELEPRLRQAIAREGLGDRVRVIGHAPPSQHLAQVREMLLGAEVMCLPSRSESFGLVFIEALACGTPVVGFGSTVREIRDAMGVEIGEPLDHGSAEELAAATERVLGSVWNRAELRRAATETFGPAAVADAYADLLARVAGRPAAARPA